MTEFKVGEIVKNRNGDDCRIINVSGLDTLSVVYEIISGCNKGFRLVSTINGKYYTNSGKSKFDLIPNKPMIDTEFKTLDGYWWVIYEGELIIAEYVSGAWFKTGSNWKAITIQKLGPKIEPPILEE